MEMRCRTCGYDLRGLEEHRCPECGRGFDPFDRRTFLRWPFRGRRYLVLAIVSMVMIALPFGLAHLSDLGLIDLDRTPSWLVKFGPLLLLGGLGLSGYVSTVSWKAVTDRLPWTVDRLAFVAALVISGTFYLGLIGWLIYDLVSRWAQV